MIIIQPPDEIVCYQTSISYIYIIYRCKNVYTYSAAKSKLYDCDLRVYTPHSISVEFSRDFFAGENEQNNNNNKYCSTSPLPPVGIVKSQVVTFVLLCVVAASDEEIHGMTTSSWKIMVCKKNRNTNAFAKLLKMDFKKPNSVHIRVYNIIIQIHIYHIPRKTL